MRNWDKQGLLKPDEITKSDSRRYKLDSLKNINKNIKFNIDNLKTITYARISSFDQKNDSIRQVQVLELYCAKAGFNYRLFEI